MNGAALFDAQVIVGADSGQGGQFLTAQTLNASTGTWHKPNIFGANLLAAKLQVLPERLTAGHHMRVLKVGLPDPRISWAYPRNATPANTDDMTDSTSEVIQVIAHEREGRDRGWWDQMASCYHTHSRVRSMWFTGTGREFAAASRDMAANGDHARHRLSLPSVHLQGERAMVTMPMAIEFRIELHHVQVDLVSYARGIYRLVRRDGHYAISDLSTIYERDTLTPVIPGEAVPLDREKLAAVPASYRMLAYYFSSRGYEVNPNEPGDDRPESVDALMAEAIDWLEA